MSKKSQILNSKFQIILIALAVLLFIPSRAYASDPYGNLDGTNCNNFGGWLCDPDNYAASIDVHFYTDNNVFVGAINANQTRSDLPGAGVCGGYANHGFTFTTPNWLKDGASHNIWAYAIDIGGGTNAQLVGSPKSISGCYLTLSGRVTNAATDGGMSGVTINSCDIGARTTDGTGNFSYTNIAYNTSFCLRPAAVNNFSGPNRTYECQSAGYFRTPDLCGYSPSNDLSVDNAYNFSYTPNCNATVSCTGACSAGSNTCSTNNGTQGSCVYTTYSGSTNCNRVAAPNQPCTIDNCIYSQNYYCSSGSCILRACNTTPSCTGACSATPNTCSTNNGTRSSCVYTGYSGGGSCTQAPAPNQPCTISNCSSGYTCSSGTCLPNCDSGIDCLGGTCNATPNTCAANNGTWSGCTYTAISGGGDCFPLAVPDGSEPCTTNACSGGYVCDPSTNTCRNPAFSTQCPEQTLNPRAEGLISVGGGIDKISNNFGNRTGQCVISSQAAFSSSDISRYEELKSLYYDQSKITNKQTVLSLPGSFSEDGIYSFSGDLTISSSSLSGTGTQVIFVDDGAIPPGPANLIINQSIVYSDGNSGLVFVVNGDVNIDPLVTQIDAVIISSGTIYTAGAGCTTNGITEVSPGTLISALTINGSLISLDPIKPIQFCRNLFNNDDPAEKINQQPKYLVLLRKLYSITLEKWSEIP